MTKTHLFALALAASLSLPTLVQAGGFDGVFHPEPRVEGPSVSDIADVFHNTDTGGGGVDIGKINDVFHSTDDDIAITVPPGGVLDHPGGIGLSNPPTGGIGTVKVGKAGTQTASAAEKLVVELACAVAGTPSEFPDDLRITNAGPTTIPVGTRIKWQTKAPRLSGAAVLSAPLKAGKSVSLSGVFAGGLEAGTPCSVKAIGL